MLMWLKPLHNIAFASYSIKMSQQNEEKMPRPLTYEDQEFYEAELKVLGRLNNNANDRDLAAACEEMGIDEYDFKDRWRSLLRRRSPMRLLEMIEKIS
jgi:hypothetical protein